MKKNKTNDTDHLDTPVLIAGGGPVGMTLALFLAYYGVRSILLERNPTTTRHPKMDLTNGRSMELYHKLGLADKCRAAGVPGDQGFDVAWITNMVGAELYRFHYRSPEEFAEASMRINDGSFTREAPMRVSQIILEPVLKAAVDASPLVDVRFNTTFEKLKDQNSEIVVSVIRNNQTGKTATVNSSFLVGADGGGSRVRRQSGIELDGDLAFAGAYMVHFRSKDPRIFGRWPPTYHYQNGGGTIIAQDGVETWTLQRWIMPDENPEEMISETVLEDWVGSKFDYQIIQANPWAANMVIAEKYVNGRVLIAGDAAHQYIPTGGYGMNSGVADAAGLSWMLAAVLQGWGGIALLSAYEKERRPTAQEHLAAAGRHFEVRQKIAEVYAEAGDFGPEARLNATRKIRKLGNAENESWGVEHGYRYDNSPVIAQECQKPKLDPLIYTPNTCPGARLPCAFLSPGVTIYDRLGPFFTLVAFGSADVEPVVKASSAAGVPLSILRLSESDYREFYERKFLLVRPDHHIAWRADELPDEFSSVLALVTGKQ